MKIAFIYDAVYPFVTGGAEKRVYEIAKRLSQRGHEVHWYGIGWWWPEKGQKDIIMDGIHLHGVCGPMELYNDGKRSIKEAIYFALKLFPKLMKEDFDIVDCQNFPYFSCFIAKQHSLCGRSTLVITLLEVWGDYWYQYMGPMGFFGKLVEILTLKLSNRIISISSKTNRDLQNIRNVKDAVVIPPGINFNEITELKSRDKKWHIIYAGRLIKEKRIDLLIKSLACVRKNMPDVKCLIVGEGPEERQLKNLSKELGLDENIKFKGFLDNFPDLISCMKSSQVFVLPSEREGFGMVVIEANASGLPVVVVESPHNAALDLVIPGTNGFVSEAREDDLANKIIKSIQQSHKMKNECIKVAQQYGWDKITLQLEKFYQDSLECMEFDGDGT